MRDPIDRERRRLLKGLSLLPFAGSGVSMLGGGAAHATECAAAPGAGDAARSLVCVFLAGGADSFNMFVPGGTTYDEYRATRRELAVEESGLIGVSDTALGSFGFHPLLPDLARLYGERRLAVVSNTGTLIRPTTKSDYLGTTALPQSLFAHNTQQKLWQTGAGIVNGANAFGWGGAIGEHAGECNGALSIPASFSLGGSNDWLASAGSNYVSLNAGVLERMFGYDGWSDWIPTERLVRIGPLLDGLIAQGRDAGNPLLTRAIADAVGRASDATAALDSALRANALENVPFDRRNKLAAQLHFVARLIASREELGMRRQVFFVLMGGWDTHSNQLERQGPLLTELNDAIGMFQGAIDDLGLTSGVTAFTASDFGRTLTSNGNGTDHGWGGHAFVFGGAVDGGRVIGETPSYAVRDNPDDAGEDDGSFAGRIIPRISVTQYAATLSRWMGMDETDIADALPDLANFAERDLGLFRGT